MKLIEVRTIPHDEQRYDSWADWQIAAPGGPLTITVSQVNNWRYEYLAALHELLEATLCLHHGITQADVDAFDVPYETRRMAGEKYADCGCEITDDPGSDIHAPYRLPHIYATSVEYGLAKLLGVDPKAYDAAFIALDGGVAGNRKQEISAICHGVPNWVVGVGWVCPLCQLKDTSGTHLVRYTDQR